MIKVIADCLNHHKTLILIRYQQSKALGLPLKTFISLIHNRSKLMTKNWEVLTLWVTFRLWVHCFKTSNTPTK